MVLLILCRLSLQRLVVTVATVAIYKTSGQPLADLLSITTTDDFKYM